jgi:hypothetical protein
MTNDEDYVCIDGSLIIESNYTNRLTDGALEIKGDLLFKREVIILLVQVKTTGLF